MATKPISQLGPDLQKMIKELITKDMLLDVGEQIRSIIYNRTKSGKGLAVKNQKEVGQGGLKNLAKLSDSYVAYRQRQILGPFASARRSNLTFSGELLESIIVKMVGRELDVDIEDATHSTGIKLRELRDIMHEGDPEKNLPSRPFMGLSREEFAIVNNYFERKLRERIRKLQNI